MLSNQKLRGHGEERRREEENDSIENSTEQAKTVSVSCAQEMRWDFGSKERGLEITRLNARKQKVPMPQQGSGALESKETKVSSGTYLVKAWRSTRFPPKQPRRWRWITLESQGEGLEARKAADPNLIQEDLERGDSKPGILT
ncbi:hypothetical protein CISG_08787 [Coccidioides immitis RMSCC 3703]|uniref:Uncharacterized protein n=2 Tax=Coccidioides immitis TaxID=5501 RepID=A0A0J8RA59_COCIT|nr:hypothetical protein CIRG_05528 [Coccidioides immitis RMSCC 2394]KMU80723.1 hypothetical protein CISG_08787 [Coccidioides immitis RMSCC 3703]